MIKKTTICHIDDSKIEVDYAKKIFNAFTEIDYIGYSYDAGEGVKMVLDKKPDILFLDIEMQGEKDGLWVAEQLKDSKTFIVFLTSHNEYMAQAFEACAIHYILKPICSEMVAEVLARQKRMLGMSNMLQSRQISELMENYLNIKSSPQRIFIHNLGRTHILDIEKLVYCVSSGSCTIFKTEDGTKYTASKLIRIYAEALKNNPDFVRVHRCYIINRNYVKAIMRNKHKISLQMTDGTEIEVSPKLRDNIEVIMEM